ESVRGRIEEGQRRFALLRVEVRLRADPLDRPLRLAYPVPAGAAWPILLLARGWAAHGPARSPARLRHVRALQYRVRAHALPANRGRPSCRHCHPRHVRPLAPPTTAAVR